MTGSHLDALVGNDDAAMHDLFSATRVLLRIYEMSMTDLFRLVDTLEHGACGEPVSTRDATSMTRRNGGRLMHASPPS